jgi:hypothetical protein
VNDLAEPAAIDVDLSRVPRDRLARMIEAAADVVECHRILANTSDNIVGELLRDVGTFYEWNHYPEGDVYDPRTHAQYYYHAHPQELRGGEHGHFHTFLRPKGMPDGMAPAPVPDFAAPEGENDALSHLIGISMDPTGIPIRLFTTNRWVTGEVWYAADDVSAMLDLFLIDHARPSWPVNKWIGAMIQLFHPQIVALIAQRDRAVAAWTAAHPESNVYEDRGLEVTSSLDISVDEQIARLRAALGENS